MSERYQKVTCNTCEGCTTRSANILCCICQELATHKCHVYDKSWFNSPNCDWPERDDKHLNIIILCANHHGLYFDKHFGDRDAPGNMLIDLERNKLFILDPKIRNPDINDIESYEYHTTFELLEEYVDDKNQKCHDILYSGWLELTGQDDEWL